MIGHCDRLEQADFRRTAYQVANEIVSRHLKKMEGPVEEDVRRYWSEVTDHPGTITKQLRQFCENIGEVARGGCAGQDGELLWPMLDELFENVQVRLNAGLAPRLSGS